VWSQTEEVNVAGTAATSKLHPWHRFFARTFDICLFSLLAAFALGLFFPSLYSGKSGSGQDNLMGLAYLVMYVPVEGFYLYAFGTTPGKALHGIKLVYNGGQLSWLSAARRSLTVWVRGLGLGIPIVSLITMGNAYSSLKNNHITSWDKQLGWSVTTNELRFTRWIGILSSWAAIAAIVALLMTLNT
jgi:hypothetical protein